MEHGIADSHKKDSNRPWRSVHCTLSTLSTVMVMMAGHAILNECHATKCDGQTKCKATELPYDLSSFQGTYLRSLPHCSAVHSHQFS